MKACDDQDVYDGEQWATSRKDLIIPRLCVLEAGSLSARSCIHDLSLFHVILRLDAGIQQSCWSEHHCTKRWLQVSGEESQRVPCGPFEKPLLYMIRGVGTLLGTPTGGALLRHEIDPTKDSSFEKIYLFVGSVLLGATIAVA